jgi:Zn-dependent membrane protease YugP
MYILWYDPEERHYRLDLVLGEKSISAYSGNEMDILHTFQEEDFYIALKVVNKLNNALRRSPI